MMKPYGRSIESIFDLRGGMVASQTRKASFFLQARSDDGMWRSPVAQRSGGPEVASSNLVIPTISDFFEEE